jgi:hypothetical protein
MVVLAFDTVMLVAIHRSVLTLEQYCAVLSSASYRSADTLYSLPCNELHRHCSSHRTALLMARCSNLSTMFLCLHCFALLLCVSQLCAGRANARSMRARLPAVQR